MPPIFGYGSLVLPTSLISRFENLDTALKDIYDRNTDRYVREDALSRWENRRNRITYVPAKIWGFQRYYSFESERGDMMLEALRTNDADDWINGVLIFGLTPDEEREITQSETGYDYTSVRNPTREYYIDPDKIDTLDGADVSGVQIYTTDKSQKEIIATKPRNQIYHDRIITGIMMIGEMYGEQVAREFYEDFRKTTYETAYDSLDTSEFNTVRENDFIRGESNWPALP